jgi:dephospho-CoA kinase
MLKLGVTGGIGAGKSTVCRFFEQLKVPVFNADNEAKLLLSSQIVKDFYRNEFGGFLFVDNEIDKAKLASLIFNNPEALQKVNNFIHPLVYKVFSDWCLLHKESTYVINEAALLFESKAKHELDFILLVQAPIEQRIQNIIERDHTTREAILTRINNQMNEDEKVKLADFIIYNNEKTLLIPNLLEIHNKLTNRANK